MLLESVFPRTAGIADPRSRRSITPYRVVTTFGEVTGAMYLTEPKPSQVAIYPHHDGCFLRSGAEGERAAVLVDFGIELHGSLNISVWTVAPAGGTVDIRIRTGESVGEALTLVGERGTTNDHATRDFVMPVSFYSSNETPETGFRFAYIELETPSAAVELRAVTATLIYRELEYIGSFASSDELLNRIYTTSAYTVHLNMQRCLWDGIKRDRLVWAGDMNTEVNTILAVFGNQCDVVQRSLDLVRDVTPAEKAMNGLSSYSLWWTLCQYDWYMGTGDYAYLMEQKEYIKEMVPHWFAFIDENGAEKMPEGRFFDWPNRTNPAGTHAGLQGLLRMALLGAAEIMRITGESALAAQCVLHADRLLAHRPDPAGQKQPAALLGLSGVCGLDGMVRDVILPGGAQGLSTFLGYYTLTAAAEAGYVPQMLDIVRSYWGKMLEMGATTFWEDFDVTWTENAHRIDELPVPGKKDIHGDFGAHCYRNFRHSLCHGWASGPAPVLAKYVLGVRPAEAGFAKVKIHPNPAGLAWVKGSVPTPRGAIEVEYENGSARISVPDGVEVVD